MMSEQKELLGADHFMRVWKHIPSETFADAPNGGTAGGTIFLSYDKMIPYLLDADRPFHIAELLVRPWEIEVVDTTVGMAVLKVDRFALNGFKPMLDGPMPRTVSNVVRTDYAMILPSELQSSKS